MHTQHLSRLIGLQTPFTAVRGEPGCLAASRSTPDCRSCTCQAASTAGFAYSAFHQRTHCRFPNTQPLCATMPNGGVVSERKATDSLRETLESTGPVRDLG